MGAVFKKSFTKAVPVGPEFFIREGQRFARWRDGKGKARKARVTVGQDGTERITLESKYYFAKYRTADRIVRTVPTGCRDETAARSVLAELERRAELVKSGVMTSNEDSAIAHEFARL